MVSLTLSSLCQLKFIFHHPFRYITHHATETPASRNLVKIFLDAWFPGSAVQLALMDNGGAEEESQETGRVSVQKILEGLKYTYEMDICKLNYSHKIF